MEPVVGNMGVVPPEKGFLEAIVALCKEHGAVSIFDEVMTAAASRRGWRSAGIRPDLTCAQKIIGGGMPLAAYGGKRAIMENIRAARGRLSGGTLSGNPVAVSAALAQLALLDSAVYEKLEQPRVRASRRADLRREERRRRLRAARRLYDHDVLHRGPAKSFGDAVKSDTKRFGRWHGAMLSWGQYWPPSQYEAAFISATHTDAIIDATIAAADEALAQSIKE